MRDVLVCVLALFSAACGSDATSLDGGRDGGAVDDASVPADAGLTPDGGMDADATSPFDAGSLGVDAGSTGPVDAGPVGLLDASDSGPDPCEAPFVPVADPLATPPFSGTAFITDDLITEDDPTAFVDLSYMGQENRRMFDRRAGAFITVDAHLFPGRFGSATTIEIQVNPEFSRAEAEVEALRYAEVIGRLPAFLLRDVETVAIHRGTEPFGGGNRNLLIHTGQAEVYARAGELEEIFVHEAAHNGLDAEHARNPRWLEAQEADGVPLSTYARDFPVREDVAETLGPYLAVRLRTGRFSADQVRRVAETIPNRIQYFDCLDLSMDILP